MNTEEILQLARRWKEWPDIEEVRAIRPLGIGSKRCAVQAEEGLVAKIPWREKGLWENAAEAALWEWAPPELRKLLAPVRDLRGGVLWQDRCTEASLDPKILQELARWGITDSAVNLGSLRGQTVCYDYATFGEKIFQEIRETIAKNEQNGCLDI